MGSIVYTSHSYSSLADKLCNGLVAEVKKKGIHEQTILVPNHTLANWLSNEIANRLGVCLNIKFAYLDSLLAEHQANESMSHNSRLSWTLSILQTLRSLDEQSYSDLQEESSAIQYAWEFSSQLEKYIEYRNEWTRDWGQLENAPSRWVDLFSRCWQDIEYANLKNDHLLVSAIDVFNNPQATFPFESRTIHLFGFWEFSPLRWNLLNALFPETNFITYLSLPTKTYLGDLTKSSLQLPLFSEEENILLNPRLKLLSKLSPRGRGFQAFLLDHNVHVEQIDPKPSSKSILGLLQRLLIDPEHSHKSKLKLLPDQSIQLHSCTSKKRELEVAKAQIQRSLLDDPTLKLEDIHIHAPNIQDYIEWIPVVFSEKDPECTLTFSIRESLEPEKISVFRLLLDLLKVPQSNLSVKSIKSLLSHEGIKFRFKFTDEDVENIFDWIEKSAIWGGENESEEDYSSADNFYSWKQGLSRMLELYASGNETDIGFENFSTNAPFDKADTFERFLKFYRSIENWSKEALQCEQHGILFIDLIHKALPSFITEDYNSFEQSALQKTLSSLEQAFEVIPNTLITVSQFSYLLKKSLPQLPPPNALSRRSGIQFSSIRYEEMTPGKLKIILGLQDGSFPRNDPQRSYDLIQQTESRFGDPSQRDQDLYWLLHTFILAKEKWIASFVGQDEFSNEKLPVSPLVQTILETVNKTLPDFCGLKDKTTTLLGVTLQPRFSYDAKSFETSPLIQHFESRSFETFKNLSLKTKVNSFMDPVSDTDEESSENTLHLKELISFFSHPARYFCRNVLGLDLKKPPLTGEKSTEPLLWEEDFLQDFQINQIGLKSILSNLNLSHLKNNLMESGVLPIGLAGESDFRQRQTAWSDYFENLPDGACFRIERDSIQTEKLACGSGTLIIPTLNDPIQQIGLLSAGNLKKSASIAVWIYSLALASGCQKENHPAEIIHAGKDTSIRFLIQDDATDQLRQLVEIWEHHKSTFFPFFPETSFVAYQKKYSPEQLAENPKWTSSMFGGEFEDPYNRLLTGGEETPFNQGFFEAADTFYSMMEQSIVASGKGTKK